MKRLKKYAYPILMSALGVLLAGGIYSSFIAPKEVEMGVSINKMYSSVQDLKNEADLIVEGTSLPNQKTIKHGQILFTHTDFKVNQVHKGVLGKKNIKILETGGFDGKHHLTVEGNRVMNQNQNYILFLEKYEGPVTKEESYVVIGAYQGRFAVDGQEVTPGNDVAGNVAKVESKQALINSIKN